MKFAFQIAARRVATQQPDPERNPDGQRPSVYLNWLRMIETARVKALLNDEVIDGIIIQ